MIKAIEVLLSLFTMLFLVQTVMAMFGHTVSAVVLRTTILLLVLFTAAYWLMLYAQAQGKSDYIKNMCDITVTPLTVVFYPDLAEAELDYCLDAGKQPTSINP